MTRLVKCMNKCKYITVNGKSPMVGSNYCVNQCYYSRGKLNLLFWKYILCKCNKVEDETWKGDIWFEVANKLPEHRTDVLIHYQYIIGNVQAGGVMVAYYDHNSAKWYGKVGELKDENFKIMRWQNIIMPELE